MEDREPTSFEQFITTLITGLLITLGIVGLMWAVVACIRGIARVFMG